MPIDPTLASLVDDGRIEDFEGDWLSGVVARLEAIAKADFEGDAE